MFATKVRARLALVASVLFLALIGATGCSSSLFAEFKLDYSPGDGSTDVSPADDIFVKAEHGKLESVTLTSPAGHKLDGRLNASKDEYHVTEPLGFGKTYTWSGTAKDGSKSVKIEGSFTTITPDSLTYGSLNIGDDQTVGIAAPIIIQFDSHVEDKAAVERAITVKTSTPTEGAWAWLPDDNGSRLHWRPREYWKPGTKVEVNAKLYGVNMGDGAYGGQDLSLEFQIGRSQIVKADATTHRMQVVRDGEVIMDFAVSYGEGTEDRNTTRSGTHIVQEKHEHFKMTNEPYYRDVDEYYAVRISNNGEFIHANPNTVGSQGSANVSNGCINLNLTDAQNYFESALYGDPVEVTGTNVDLSAADGDIYDWTIDWATWKSMSALDGSAKQVVSASAKKPEPIGGN
ncbi:MAG: Ig-like domain-containing protein [Nocardiaceae bacterium]|nr:Ig-like domain-containing protein [Nocardiaceae bacterium]